MEIYSFKSKIGWLTLEGDEKSLFRVSFLKTDRIDTPKSKELKKARKQLEEFLDGARTTFNIKLDIAGTDFQKKIWESLEQIPYGQTSFYGKLAEMAGSPKASRAVGMANNKNPLPIIIPCHRVIGKDGSLTGYAGGLETKKILLNLENNTDFRD